MGTSRKGGGNWDKSRQKPGEQGVATGIEGGRNQERREWELGIERGGT